jgi:hypothetical protein
MRADLFVWADIGDPICVLQPPPSSLHQVRLLLLSVHLSSRSAISVHHVPSFWALAPVKSGIIMCVAVCYCYCLREQDLVLPIYHGLWLVQQRKSRCLAFPVTVTASTNAQQNLGQFALHRNCKSSKLLLLDQKSPRASAMRTLNNALSTWAVCIQTGNLDPHTLVTSLP